MQNTASRLSCLDGFALDPLMICNHEHRFLVAEQLKLFKLKGLELDYLNKFYEMIQNVTAAQLLDCAIKYLDINSLSEVVVGNGGNK